MTWTTDSRTVSVSVKGTIHQVDEDANFAETVNRLAREAGIRKFRVLVDGEEIEPDEAPNSFEDVDRVEIVTYDKAG